MQTSTSHDVREKPRKDHELSQAPLDNSAQSFTPPHPPLLNLIAAFLTQYGLHSTCREFKIERRQKIQREGWPADEDEQLDEGLPSLIQLFAHWHEQRHEKDSRATSKIEKGISANINGKGTITRREREDTTSSDSNSDSVSSDNESDNKAVVPRKRAVARKGKDEKMDTSDSTDTTSSSSSEDDDVSDEEQPRSAAASTLKGIENLRKRKRSQSSSSESTTDSDSSSTSSDNDKSDSKKPDLGKDMKLGGVLLDQSTSKIKAGSSIQGKSQSKVNQSKANKLDISSDSSSSSSSSSSSDSDSDVSVQAGKTRNVAPGKVSSGSSATLVAGNGGKAVISKSSSSDTSTSASTSDSSDSASGSASSITAKKEPTISSVKRKRSPEHAMDGDTNQSKKARQSLAESTQVGRNSKPQSKPFSRIPADLQVDERLKSNAYVPYDYAERAHKDLIVTKGKRFTKEKNKKKRGSYRGGTIDIHGKKGIKFD